ncbi:MAG: HlyD family type I secretion periplasmic adaptor subunit [Gammaproteobacteria bacterium]|nr:HlyD family type I secretion periplasmic adaptor subunit [Gammaproteobacteria bacterium]
MSGNDTFSPHLLSVEKTPPSPLPTLLLRLLLLFIAIILIWAFWGRLDIVARAEGTLVPQNRVQIVQPLEDSRVERILVKEGQRVNKDQVLFTMDSTLTLAEKRKYQYEVALARLQLERIDAQLENRPLQLSDNAQLKQAEQVSAQYHANTAAYETQINEAKAEKQRIEQELSASKVMVKSLAGTMPLLIETEAAYKKLQTKGYADKLGALEKKRTRIVAQKDLQEEKYRVDSLTAQLLESESRIKRIKAEYKRMLVEEQVQLNARIHQFQEELNKITYRESLTELTAPVDGIVQNVATHTQGAIVPAGTVVLSVVPSTDPLKAEVLVDNKDVAHIKPGMPVRVKVASYEFQKYGMLDGQVETISPDAINEEGNPLMKNYRVLIDLGKQFIEREGKQFDLRPGMQVISEIRLGTRTVMDYLLSPIQRAVLSSGNER